MGGATLLLLLIPLGASTEELVIVQGPYRVDELTILVPGGEISAYVPGDNNLTIVQ